MRHSADRFQLKLRISGDARRAMVIGFLSLVPIPPLAPYAIHLGVRSFKAARSHDAGLLASLMSLGAILLGSLGLVVFILACHFALALMFGW